MPGRRSPTPRQAPPVHIDESKLPSGQCRFILLNPEVKGQRCACVSFTLNHALPGVACECGHNSCYHIKSAEPAAPDRAEIQLLRRRVQQLEEQLDRENKSGLGMNFGRLVRRISELEERVERDKEEVGQDMKGCYLHVDRTWQSVNELSKRQMAHEDRFTGYDERLDRQDDALQGLSDRLGEFNEASIALEERVDELEDSDVSVQTSSRSGRGSSSSASPDPVRLKGWQVTAPRRPSCNPPHGQDLTDTAAGRASRPTKEWTVHVSLLPTASQPFPFEKDTTAYKRCLSRGMHRMVAVDGTDSESFVAAVSKAFEGLLKGREWMPLEAQVCDAAPLQGLPMLRPLDRALVGRHNYDLAFLRRRCAVCAPDGRLESLYIAMVSGTLSWPSLRAASCYVEGLEACWAPDPALDRNETLAEGDHHPHPHQHQHQHHRAALPAAGNMMVVLPLSTLKRKASNSLSAATSPDGAAGAGGAGAGETSRPKLQRTTCVPVQMEELHRHNKVETV